MAIVHLNITCKCERRYSKYFEYTSYHLVKSVNIYIDGTIDGTIIFWLYYSQF